MGLGARSVLRDLGHKARVCVMTDSSAAKGMASRKGLGKVRHVEVNQLWVQQKVGSGEIELRKVEGRTTWQMLSPNMSSMNVFKNISGVRANGWRMGGMSSCHMWRQTKLDRI